MLAFTIKSLGIKALDAPSINECLLCELSVQSKRRYINVMYRSQSQNNDEFDEFLNSFENLLSNIAKSSPLLTVRSTSWWVNDKTILYRALVLKH